MLKKPNLEREYGRFFYASEIPESPPERPWCPYGYTESSVVITQKDIGENCDNIMRLKVVGSDCV